MVGKVFMKRKKAYEMDECDWSTDECADSLRRGEERRRVEGEERGKGEVIRGEERTV